MSIHKRVVKSGVRYEVRLRGTDGAERSKSFRTRKDAESYERAQLTDKARGTWSDPRAGRVTLAEWVTEWQRTIVHLRPSSIRIYDTNLRLHVLPVLGAQPLGKITTPMLRGWLSDLMVKHVGRDLDRTLAPATVHQAYRALHVVLMSAVENGYVGRNPLDGVKPPKVEHEQMRFLTAEQVLALANAIDPGYRAFVLVASFCGLRAGELLGLRWCNVSLPDRRIHVSEQLDYANARGETTAPKSSAGRRAVSMPHVVSKALAEHALGGYAGQRPDGFVFVSPAGGPVDLNNFRDRVWRPAIAKAGVAPLRIHDMRHTCASLAIAAGADVKVVQNLLGHASAAMTLDRYGHLMPGRSEAVADRLDALVHAAAG